MTSHDVISNLVDKLIAEKEKNFLLQTQLNQLQGQQASENKPVQD